MGIYRIIDSNDRTQIGPAAGADTMAAMFEPVELVLVDDRVGCLDLEKLDPGSGEWLPHVHGRPGSRAGLRERLAQRTRAAEGSRDHTPTTLASTCPAAWSDTPQVRRSTTPSSGTWPQSWKASTIVFVCGP